jgi:putative ABC transport system permease protein
MGRPNIPLIEVPTIFLNLNDLQIIYVLFGMITITVIILFFIFSSEIGLAIRAGRRNYMLAESYGMSKSFIILSTLGLSNALVSLAGGLIAQMQGFVDINMGNGILIVGLISIILGQKIYHFKNLCCNFIMCIIGALIYKSATVVAIFALDFGFMSSDIYLLSAIIMIIITVKIKKNIT